MADEEKNENAILIPDSARLYFLSFTMFSVADPYPEGSETFGRIRIRSGTVINVSYPDPKI